MTCIDCGSGDVFTRSLCRHCYGRARWEGRLDNYPRTYRRSADIATDYQWIKPSGDSGNQRIRNAASRLGISFGALEKALQRQGVKP